MNGNTQPKKRKKTGRKLKGFTEVYDAERDGVKKKTTKKEDKVTYNKSWAEMIDNSPTGQEEHAKGNGDALINEEEDMGIMNNTNIPKKDLDNAGFEEIDEEDEKGGSIKNKDTIENPDDLEEIDDDDFSDETDDMGVVPEDDESEEDAEPVTQEEITVVAEAVSEGISKNDEKSEDEDEEDSVDSEDDDYDSDDSEGEEPDEDGTDANKDDSDDSEDNLTNEEDDDEEIEIEVKDEDGDGSDDTQDNDSEEDDSEDEDGSDDTQDNDSEEDDADNDEDKDMDKDDGAGDTAPINHIMPITNTPVRRPPAKKKTKRKKSLFDIFKKGKTKPSTDNTGDNPKKEKVPLKKKWHEWWFGTEEHPVKPFSFKGKLTRWFLKTFCGYVDYITTMYDKPLDEIRCDVELVKKSKVPREAVHVTNMKRTYHLDLDLPIRYFDVTRDYGFTASSAYNYARDNSITEAMAIEVESEKQPMDSGKVLLIVALIFGAVLAIWFMWPMYAG